MKILKHVLIILITFLIFFWANIVYSEPDYSKSPIFFVHGHGMKAECWESMISFLIKSGYPPKFLTAIQLRPNTGANIDAAETQMAPAIEDFLKAVNIYIKEELPKVPLKTKVDLISHSMGALSARWYAAKLRPDRVRIWISLVGANHGTNELCKYFDPGADDLCPAYAKNRKESLIQIILNGKPRVADIDETPYGVGIDSPGVNVILPDQNRSILYMTVRTSPDKWIKPEESGVLDGAGGVTIVIPKDVRAKQTSPGNILMTNRVGHDEILECPEAMKLVKSILGGHFPPALR